jgi:hypothetical protein
LDLNGQKLKETRAANSIIANAEGIAINKALDGKPYPAGVTYTISSAEGDVTFVNGNFNHARVVYPNGTTLSYNFNKNVSPTKDMKKMGYVNAMEYEYEITYKNGSTLHFYHVR